MSAVEILGTGLACLWRATWQASVLVLLVLLVQRLLRARLTPSWRHGLWWLVLLRLLLPVVPATPLSVFNLASAEVLREGTAPLESVWRRELRGAGPLGAPDGLQGGPAVAASSAAGESATPTQTAAPAARPAVASSAAPREHVAVSPAAYALWGAFGLWLLGVFFLGARLIWGNWKFARRLRQCAPETDPTRLALLEECRQKVSLRSRPILVETADVDSPALFGCWRVKLLVPPKIVQTFSPAELRHVFLHELAHVRRGDVATNWLMAVVRIAHWFNPAIWFACSRMRADRELATDALALSVVHEPENQRYGQTIIKLLEGFVRPATGPGLVGILETQHEMKRRISMIAKFKKTNRWPGLAIAAFTGLAVIALTDAQTKTDSIASSVTQTSLLNAKLKALFKPVTTIAGANDVITSADPVVLSPNGKFLNWQGLVVPMDGSKPFPLTDRRVWSESWAPNGKLIACCGVDGLYVVPVNAETGHATGPAKKLVSGRLKLWADTRLDWTADSARVFFVAWNQDYSGPVSKAVVVSSGKVVDAPDWAELGLRSPDEKTIAYSPRGDGVWVRPAAGGPARNLGAVGESKWCEPLAWSADGQWVISQVGPGDNGEEVRLIRLADSQEFRILVPTSVGRFVGKSATGDGIYFYRTSYDLAFVPKVMSVQGGTPVCLATRNRGLLVQNSSQLFVTAEWASGMPYAYQQTRLPGHGFADRAGHPGCLGHSGP